MTGPTTPTPGRTGDGPDTAWEALLFRRSVVPTVAVGVVAVLAFGLSRGTDGALGALLGAALVIGSFGLSLYVAHRTADLHPLATLTAAMLSYLIKITLLLVVLLVVRGTGVVDRHACGFTVLACALVWLAAEVHAFTRLRLLYVDPGAGPERGAPHPPAE